MIKIGKLFLYFVSILFNNTLYMILNPTICYVILTRQILKINTDNLNFLRILM